MVHTVSTRTSNLTPRESNWSMIFQHGFEQLIQHPTHHYISGGLPRQSLIDIALTNCKKCHNASGVLTCSVSPDHDLVYAIRRKPSLKGPAKTIHFRPLKSCNEALFKTVTNTINSMPWWALDICADTNEVFKMLSYFTNYVLDQTLPMKTILVKTKQPKWLTADFKRLLHRRDSAKAQFQKSRTRESWENFRCLRNEVNVSKNKLKSKELRRVANDCSKSENKSKVEWRQWNEEIDRGKRQPKINSLRDGSVMTSVDSEIAELFCKEFSNIVSAETPEISFENLMPVFGRDYFDTLNYLKFSTRTVEEGLSNVNPHKPPESMEFQPYSTRDFILHSLLLCNTHSTHRCLLENFPNNSNNPRFFLYTKGKAN